MSAGGEEGLVWKSVPADSPQQLSLIARRQAEQTARRRTRAKSSMGGSLGTAAATDDTGPKACKVRPIFPAEGVPPEFETGGLMTQWASVLDPALIHLTVGNGDSVSLSSASLFSRIAAQDKTKLVSLVVRHYPRSRLAKAMGSLCALAAADATGHWFEFMNACDKPGVNRGGSVFDVSKLQYTPASQTIRRPQPDCFSGMVYNKFNLQMGQWTDDCSMALAMADSLIVKQGYDGSDVRVRFWNWWNKGYCNGGLRGSVGLGGNISKSLYSMEAGQIPTPRYDARGEDSGNGSLMRLAPIALYYSTDLESCMRFARESSYTTHPGEIAAECCALQAFLIARAIEDPRLPIETEVEMEGVGPATATVSVHHRLTARSWLEEQADKYLQNVLGEHGGAGVDEVRRLLMSAEPKASTESNWNWRNSAEEGLPIEETLRNRGWSYNGHPVSAGYFGSYAVDGLAVALHCVASTSSLNSAVERCINFLGDADSTGAITGQLAGAIYGIEALHPAFVKNLQQWDNGDVAVRAYMLHFMGLQQVQKSKLEEPTAPEQGPTPTEPVPGSAI